MLPIIPHPFKLVVRQVKTEDGYRADPSALKQLDVIRKLLNQAGSVIICTDAAREGELIARYVLDYLGYTKETINQAGSLTACTVLPKPGEKQIG